MGTVNADWLSGLFTSLNNLRSKIYLSTWDAPTISSQKTIRSSDFKSMYNMIKDMERNDPYPPTTAHGGSGVAPTLNFDSGEANSGTVIKDSTRTKIITSADGWLKYQRSISRRSNSNDYSFGDSVTTNTNEYSVSDTKTTHTTDSEGYGEYINSNGYDQGNSQTYKTNGDNIGDSRTTKTHGNTVSIKTNGYNDSAECKAYYRYDCVSEKYFLFSMIEYDLILFFDADCLIKKSWDDIFDSIPGTTFSPIQIKNGYLRCPAQMFFIKPDLKDYEKLMQKYTDYKNKNIEILEESLFAEIFLDKCVYQIPYNNYVYLDIFLLNQWDHCPGINKYWKSNFKNIYSIESAKEFIEWYKTAHFSDYFNTLRESSDEEYNNKYANFIGR